jgi:hypothetical protein
MSWEEEKEGSKSVKAEGFHEREWELRSVCSDDSCATY